ncbi:MAG: tetratricopeptide repeat protein [Balneola sp.]
MKNSTITRYASLVLVIGFFVSCSSTKFSVDNLVDQENYQEAIDKISIEISKNPSSSLYFQKGKVHGLAAQKDTVINRKSSYQSMISAFDSALVYQTELADNSIEEEIDSLNNYYWNLEHQTGLKEYESGTEQSLQTAIAHFNNAIVIDSEKVESYKSLSIALYNNDDLDGAINTLKKAESINNADSEVSENLGFLYLEMGNPEQSIFYYQKANQDPLKNKNIAFGLVNAYISQNRTSEAVTFLDQLIEEYPKEAKLHNVYGTQLYIQVSELFSNLKTSYASNDTSAAQTLRVEIEGLSQNAEEQLVEAYKLDDSSIEFTESLAVFYNNMSGNYFSLYKSAFDSDKDDIKTKALSLTDFALDYYKKLVELNSENDSYSTKIDNLNKLKNSWTNQ